MPIPTAPAAHYQKALVWSLLALAVALLLGGLHTIYEDRMKRSRHQAERELMAIGLLQAEGVAAWREQRMADALALLDDTLFANAAATWFKTATPEHALPVQQRLRILQERAKYVGVYLVDTAGQVQLSAEGPSRQILPAPEQAAVRQALAQAGAVTVEPRADPVFAFPFFSVVTPLFDGSEPIGAVWLVSDVRSTLYHLLDQWPTPSKTAESSIVTRQGNELVYLSPLRHTDHAGPNVRSLLTRTQDPAVQAVLGARGIFAAQDYRAQDVIAMASSVPESPWLIVTKVDVDEVLANTQNRELLALGLPVTLGLLLFGVLFIFWQRRAWLRERALKTDLQRNMRLLESAQKAAAIGYFSLDVAQQRYVMSRMADTIFGTSESGLVYLDQWKALIHPQDRQHIVDLHIQALKLRQPLRTQYRIVRSTDHQVRWVEVWCEVELDEDGKRVTYMTGTVQDITERKQVEEELSRYRTELEAKVRLDPLTQIANRRALDEQLAAEWQRAMRRSSRLAFLMVDVDFFKLYNDHYGHAAGDECLKKIAQTIAASVSRAGELAARYGGEEFAVLLPEADLARALETAERICQAVRLLHLAHEHSAVAPFVTVSIGVVSVQPVFAALESSGRSEAGQLPPGEPSQPSVQAMVNQADEALYLAKTQGRNRALAYVAAPEAVS